VELPSPTPDSTLFTKMGMNFMCGSYNPQFSDVRNGKLVVICKDYSQTPLPTQTFLFSTSDAGNTWTSTTYPGGTLLMLDANTGWALGHTIYQTTDGGATWAKLNSVNWDAQFSFVSSQVGWAVASADDRIALVKTFNGGKGWALLQPEVAP
jgi:hypothetical protein